MEKMFVEIGYGVSIEKDENNELLSDFQNQSNKCQMTEFLFNWKLYLLIICMTQNNIKSTNLLSWIF